MSEIETIKIKPPIGILPDWAKKDIGIALQRACDLDFRCDLETFSYKEKRRWAVYLEKDQHSESCTCDNLEGIAIFINEYIDSLPSEEN